MSDPIDFYRTFQGLLQNTKDTDWIVEPSAIASLVTLF